MKPLTINLVIKKNIREKVFPTIAVIFAIAALGATLTNTYDYYATTKVINVYELRIEQINMRFNQKQKMAQNKVVDKKESNKIKQDFNYLGSIIKKNMFSLPGMLTQIEKAKPDKIDINKLIFSENFKVVKIRGESSHAGSVSKFIAGMDKSEHFNVELSNEEINEDKRIFFELNVRWMAKNND